MRFSRPVKLISTLLLLALMLTVAGCGGSASPAPAPSSGGASPAPAAKPADTTPITIAVMGDFTGPVAAYSGASLNGATLAMEEINAAGGINGKKVQIKQYDDKNDPVEGVNIAKRIPDEALGAIVTSGSSPALAAGPVLDKAGIPFMTTVASTPAVTESGWKYVNRMHLSDRDQINRIIEYAVGEKKFSKIAILYDTSDLGVNGYKMAVDGLKAKNITAVVAEGWKQTDADFGNLVLKIKDAGAECVILWGVVEGAVRIVQATRAAGLDKVQFFGGGGLVSQKYIDLGGKPVEGTIATWAYVDSASGKAADLAKKYQAKYNKPMDVFAAQSYDAMKILLGAIAKAGTETRNREAIEAAIRATKYDGAVGHIEFSPQGHNIRQIYLATVKDGKYTLLK